MLKKKKKAQIQIGSVVRLHSQELTEEGLEGRCAREVGGLYYFQSTLLLLLCYPACPWLTDTELCGAGVFCLLWLSGKPECLQGFLPRFRAPSLLAAQT